METKWQYLAHRCAEKGYHTARIFALEIDELLEEQEYPKTTIAWDADMESGRIGNLSIEALSQATIYCTACHTHDGDCNECIFSAAGGATLWRSFNDAVGKRW